MCTEDPKSPHVGLAFPAGVAGVVVVPANAYTVTRVYDEFFGIAQWLRDESAHWRESGNSVAEGRCGLASMLHCFLALEAYINTYAALAAGLPNSPTSAKALARLEMLPPDTKWLVFPLLFMGRAVFDPQREPLKSFAKLKRMRDRFIVHHKPKLWPQETIDNSAREGRSSMAVRGLRIPETALADWQDPPCNCNADGACWACNVVTQMVAALQAAAKAAGPGPMQPPGVTVFEKPSYPEGQLVAPVELQIYEESRATRAPTADK